MTARSVTHPSVDVLRAFALGKLNAPTAEDVMSHLDSCPDCCKQAASLSGDDFLSRLRQAHGRSSTAAPAESLSDAVRAPQPTTKQIPIAELPPELAVNQQYEILRELGRGGMGVVYLAKNKLMDRLEVLKVVNKALLDHPGAVERFLREIRSAAKLSHANVVGAYSALQMGDLLAFAMEYVEGQDLASLVKSQGPLTIAHACLYAQQAACGLQHAYEKAMVHRDIKPQNLILAREGKKHIVKVLDFGLAKVMREKTEDTGLTGEGKMLGTPDYIAPEQTLDAAKADIRADIYSLGCTLYYLLAGRPPFSANSLGAILLAHQMQEAKALNTVRPEVPEELAAVVRKMMAKSPANRYQTPADVVKALAPFGKQGATPKSESELSSGSVEAKPAVKKATPVASPPPVPKGPKQPPARADVRRSLMDDSIASVRPRASKVVRKPRAAIARDRAAQKKWLTGGGIGMGVLLFALLGLWAGGVFKSKIKTTEGILVVEVNEPNPEVFVDGVRVSVSWDYGGKKAEVRVKPGTRKVEVKKDGFSADGTELTFQDGDKVVFTARLLANKPDERVKREANTDATPPKMPPAQSPTTKPDAPPVEDVAKEDKDSKPLINDTQSPTRPADSALPPEAKAAVKAFDKAREDARAKLLAEFDTTLDRLAKLKGSTQQRLRLIEAVKEEKMRFENSGLIPWSEPMRPYLPKYFLSISKAEEELRRAYSSLIDAQLRAKKESTIADLQADLTKVIGVQLWARWRHSLDGRPQGFCCLYSNGVVHGTINENVFKGTWSFANGVFIYRWPDPKAPGGAWVDTLKVSADGIRYEGSNQQRVIKLSGEYER